MTNNHDETYSLFMELVLTFSLFACITSMLSGYSTINLMRKGIQRLIGKHDTTTYTEKIDPDKETFYPQDNSDLMEIDNELDSQKITNSYFELLKKRLESYGLSGQEQQITFGIISMQSNKDIAQKLYLSTSSIKNRLKSIFEKTCVNSRQELWEVVNLGLSDNFEEA